MKSSAFNQFASKRVCVETDQQWDGSASKRVALRSASKSPVLGLHRVFL